MRAPDPQRTVLERVRRARRQRLFAAETTTACAMATREIETVLPHREPMRLVDRVRGLDLERGRAWGEHRVLADDRGFDGHFVDRPVYPGVLQLEAAGQLALIAAAIGRGLTAPAPVRLTRVLEAAFIDEVGPNTMLTLLCERVADDGYVLTSIGQVLDGDRIVCTCALEAMWID